MKRHTTLTPELVQKVRTLAAMGATNKQITDFSGLSYQTICRLKRQNFSLEAHQEFTREQEKKRLLKKAVQPLNELATRVSVYSEAPFEDVLRAGEQSMILRDILEELKQLNAKITNRKWKL